MRGWQRGFAAISMAGMLLSVGLVGCGVEETGAPVAATEPPAGKPSEGQKAGKTTSTTPVQDLNTKGMSKVEKAETVKGGEATEGPTPSDEFWLPANKALIKDEPLKVEVPLGVEELFAKVNVPVSNPLTKGKYELGRQLYFEPRVSLDGTVSCATCHNPAKGWTDGMAVSTGIDGQTGDRSAPTVINTVYGKTMFWDGRAPSLEGQAQGPIQNSIEMGKQSYKEIIERLRKIPAYTEQFEKVFGTKVTLDGMAKAIATFERVAALSGNSKYDKYAKGDAAALNESEKRGMILFGLRQHPEDEYKTKAVLQKAKCTVCHVGSNFTDEQFHNLGIGWDSKGSKFADFGRWKIDPIGAKNDSDMGAFKTPTVRNITDTGPYMHDGSLTTLEAVMDHYDKGGTPNPTLDVEMKPLNLTKEEKADVIAFMKALSGEMKTLEELLPTLPKGPDGQSPDPRLALGLPSKKVAAILWHQPAAN
jgi:cytochrome c peroxidase